MQRKLILIGLVMMIGCGPAKVFGGADTHYQLTCSPFISNRVVILTPLNISTPSGVAVKDRIKRVSDSSGSFWVTNQADGVWQVDIQAPPDMTRCWVNVTGTAPLEASSVLVAPTNQTPDQSYAWSAATSDARYAFRTDFGYGTTDISLTNLTLRAKGELDTALTIYGTGYQGGITCYAPSLFSEVIIGGVRWSAINGGSVNQPSFSVGQLTLVSGSVQFDNPIVVTTIAGGPGYLGGPFPGTINFGYDNDLELLSGSISGDALARVKLLQNGTVVVTGVLTGNAGGLTNITTVGVGGLVTNGPIVWLVTNNTPSIDLPNGSPCNVTDGRFFIRTNNLWLQK